MLLKLSSHDIELRKCFWEVFIIGIDQVLKEVLDLGLDWEVALTRGYETKLMHVCSLLLHMNTDPRLVLREASVALRAPFNAFLTMG
jgi:hypothetical protein